MQDFKAKSAKWRRESMTPEDYANVEAILDTPSLFETAACCLALSEGCKNEKKFLDKVIEIAETPQLHLEAAMYLTYHKCFTLNQAQEFFEKLCQQFGINPKLSSDFSALIKSLKSKSLKR